MRRVFGLVHSSGLLALILLGMFISSCGPSSAGETFSPLSSPVPLDTMQSPLVTPTPQSTLTPTCNPPWPTPPAEACPWLPSPTPMPTSSIPTPTPFVPPTPPAQTPTPLSLPQAAGSPAGEILFAAFFAPGSVPAEPQVLRVPIGEQGQPVGSPSPFTWTPLGDNLMTVGRLSVSPSGAYLASIYDTEVGELVVVVDLAAAQETADIYGGQFFGWHPNGHEFLFEQSSETNPGLWLVEASTGEYRLLAQPAELGYANISGAAISPDGQVLAYSVSGSGVAQVWMANADGSAPRLVSNASVVFSWSPDGRYLLYTGEPGAVGVSPWVMDRDAQNYRPLDMQQEPLEIIWDPVWSPTGQYVAAIGSDASYCPERGMAPPADRLCPFRDKRVYIEDMETGEVWLAAHDALDPTWSPDGSMLAVAKMDENEQVDIWLVNIGDRSLRQVTNTPELDRYPLWLRSQQ